MLRVLLCVAGGDVALALIKPFLWLGMLLGNNLKEAQEAEAAV